MFSQISIKGDYNNYYKNIYAHVNNQALLGINVHGFKELRMSIACGTNVLLYLTVLHIGTWSLAP